MNQERPYSISLLNELHQHFPELLYHSERFQTTQDVLQYIIRVANQRPYERELARAHSHIPQEPSLNSSSSSTSSSSTSSYFFQQLLSLPPRHVNRISVSVHPRPHPEYILNELIRDILNPAQENEISIPRADYITQHTTVEQNIMPDDDCAICQDTICFHQMVRRFNHCGHRYHQSCLDQSFRISGRCPVCRWDITRPADSNPQANHE